MEITSIKSGYYKPLSLPLPYYESLYTEISYISYWVHTSNKETFFSVLITWNRLFFHSPTTFLMEVVVTIHDYVMIFLTSVLAVVLISIVYSFYSSHFRLNFLERHQLERVWTVTPFVLLVFIVIPSLNSLYILDTCLFCGLTLNIIGHQWYWRYFFKDLNAYFDSYIEVGSNYLRLVEVDNRLVVPTFIPIRFLVSSADVIHSWTIPRFGVKIDAVPGRMNQFCFSRKRSGLFFGQCSEICGANHRFIPILMEAVSFKDFIKNF